MTRASWLLGCKDLLVNTWDYEDVEKIGERKIKFIPLWKLLLKSSMCLEFPSIINCSLTLGKRSVVFYYRVPSSI